MTSQTTDALDFFTRIAQEGVAALEAGNVVTVAVVKNGTLQRRGETDLTIVPSRSGWEVEINILKPRKHWVKTQPASMKTL